MPFGPERPPGGGGGRSTFGPARPPGLPARPKGSTSERSDSHGRDSQRVQHRPRERSYDDGDRECRRVDDRGYRDSRRRYSRSPSPRRRRYSSRSDSRNRSRSPPRRRRSRSSSSSSSEPVRQRDSSVGREEEAYEDAYDDDDDDEEAGDTTSARKRKEEPRNATQLPMSFGSGKSRSVYQRKDEPPPELQARVKQLMDDSDDVLSEEAHIVLRTLSGKDLGGASQHGVKFTAQDIARLEPGCCLNDNIIDWAMAELQEEFPRPEFLFCNSHLWSRIYATSSKDDAGLQRIAQTWLRKEKFFGSRCVFLPVNRPGSQHWQLLVIVSLPNLQRDSESTLARMVLLCSKGGTLSDAPKMRRFLRHRLASECPSAELFDPEDKSILPVYTPRVPEQRNVYDCGVFVTVFASLFADDPSTGQAPPEDWCSASDIANKRKSMRSAIWNLLPASCRKDLESALGSKGRRRP
eukprot:NODE_1264_length_1612_cov_24.285988_g1129_i0.p1 GENE.NODE_1264_length_1612_cov_24.285988_g1129_i0~~NODE_1264_length_1612_cov_24.285988_g1129_i0.p1  ORF type:complete len:465 (+),score=73.75 NODE_1264_length_1612_cov_24.285988_g1129_i0:147-1541(+)